MNIDAKMKVAEVYERFPQTAAVFRAFGFGALDNPVLRNTFGRFTTLERGCEMHGVPLAPFLEALNRSLASPNVPAVPEEPSECGCGCGCDEARADPAVKEVLSAKTGALVKEYPAVRAVFIKYFGEGCFSCPAFGAESVSLACAMHGTPPERFAQECLRVMR